jgi:hypothetical protein
MHILAGLLLFFGKQHFDFFAQLSTPLLSSYFYVCQQLLLFVLPMMKLSKSKAVAAFFPNSPLSSPLFCR